MRIDAILFKIIFKGCRQHERAELRLPGRYSLGNGREYNCRTIDVAAGGLAVESEEKGQIGDFVAAYVDHLGHIEGEIVRRLESGFALKILMPPARIEKLASQITSLVQLEISGASEIRQHERIAPDDGRTMLSTPDEVAFAAAPIDTAQK